MKAHSSQRGPTQAHRFFFFLLEMRAPGMFHFYFVFLFYQLFCTSNRSAAAVAASTAPPHSTTITRARDASQALAFFFCFHSFFVFILRRVSGFRFLLVLFLSFFAFQ